MPLVFWAWVTAGPKHAAITISHAAKFGAHRWRRAQTRGSRKPDGNSQTGNKGFRRTHAPNRMDRSTNAPSETTAIQAAFGRCPGVGRECTQTHPPLTTRKRARRRVSRHPCCARHPSGAKHGNRRLEPARKFDREIAFGELVMHAIPRRGSTAWAEIGLGSAFSGPPSDPCRVRSNPAQPALWKADLLTRVKSYRGRRGCTAASAANPPTRAIEAGAMPAATNKRRMPIIKRCQC